MPILLFAYDESKLCRDNLNALNYLSICEVHEVLVELPSLGLLLS